MSRRDNFPDATLTEYRTPSWKFDWGDITPRVIGRTLIECCDNVAIIDPNHPNHIGYEVVVFKGNPWTTAIPTEFLQVAKGSCESRLHQIRD